MDNETNIQSIHPDNNLPVKPKKELLNEMAIMRSLIEQGVNRKIANAVIGYRQEDVPFIYKTEPHDVLHHRVRDNWTEGYESLPGQSALWIRTTDALHNLVNKNGWQDQIPEIIVQWRGSVIPESEQTQAHTEITRTEVKQLGDGRFAQVEYGNVSTMGAFDGTIVTIALHVPEHTFVPGGYTHERQSYRIYYFRRQRQANTEGIPGGFLARKDQPTHEWLLDTSNSNVSGTTILNGFQGILNSHMHDVEAVKADYDHAYRFTPLPEPEEHLLLPTSPEQQYDIVLQESTAIASDRILELTDEANALMEIIAPLALEKIAQGGYLREAVSMEIDAILNHPDKIWIFTTMLLELPREKRFHLAQAIARAVHQGEFTKWAQMLQEKQNDKFVQDVIRRNTRHLLSWFKRTAPAKADLKGWIAEAIQGAEAATNCINVTDETVHVAVGGPASISGENPVYSPNYVRVFDGMIISFVERFVEYKAQEYFGNTLE